MNNSEIKEDKKTNLLAQELEIIRSLAGNEQNSKIKALKNLNKWLLYRSKTMPFTEEDFQRIWKGLYYCMWMSDKPLFQEECADKISKLVHFPDIDTSLLFFKAGLYILSQEWSSIQQLRLDKFLMLVRRLLREMLFALKFSNDSIESYNQILSATVLNHNNNTPVGLFMHFVEIYLEEVAKVSQGKLQPSQVLELIRPFVECLAGSSDGRKIGHLRKFIFTYLIRQSKLGLEYQDKYDAWRQQGFPGSIDSMQKVKVDKEPEDSDQNSKGLNNNNHKHLDPRAGRVDVEIPRLHFKAKNVADLLLEYKFDSKSSAQSRAMITTLTQQFTSLANGVYPLGIKKIEVKDKNEDINIRKSTIRLIRFDQKLLGKSKKRKGSKDSNNDDIVVKKKRKTEDKTNVEIVNDNPNKKIKRKSEDKTNVEIVNNNHNKKIQKNKKPKEKIEGILKKNSGIWVVYDIQNSSNDDNVMKFTLKKGKKRSSENKFTEIPISSDNPLKLGEVGEIKKEELFEKSPWDEPLQEGEYEFFVTPKKKLKKSEPAPIFNKIKGKSKLTPKLQIKLNQLSDTDTSTKKVKINTKLNKSQEFYEHYKSVKSSPGIPFDANKKPIKPLLKSTAFAGPVNPFYKKKLISNVL